MPEFSGQAAEIQAEKISVNEKPIRRRRQHRGSRIVADKNVTVKVTKQYPGRSDTERFPKAGTVISGDRAVVDTRKPVGEGPSARRGRRKISVDRGFDATVTSKTRRSRRCPQRV